MAPSMSGAVSLPFSEDELNAAIRVLTAVSSDEALYSSKPIRPLRKALAPLLQKQQQQMYGGEGNEAEYDSKRRAKMSTAIKRNLEKIRDQEYINKTRLRAARIAKLAELTKQGAGEDGESLPLIPDGAVEDDGGSVVSGGPRKRALLADGTAVDSSVRRDAGSSSSVTGSDDEDAAVPGSGIEEGEGDAAMARATSETGSSGAGASASAPAEQATPTGLLNQRACYICKRRFRDLHHFYDCLCPACAELNFRKRNQLVDLRGRVILVTGSRVKIGFQCVLRLLRCGATVIATTRFPVDGAARFASQGDFPQWRERLHMYGLDLRDMRTLEAFCSMLTARYERLDAIVNNACQTVRRPPAYFSGLIANESVPLQALPDGVRPLVQRDHDFRAGLARSAAEHAALHSRISDSGAAAGTSGSRSALDRIEIDEDDGDDEGVHVRDVKEGGEPERDDAALDEMTALPTADALPATAGAASSGGSGGSTALGSAPAAPGAAPGPQLAPSSAHLSQVAVLRDDGNASSALFPTGRLDVNAQQVDLRSRNSWLLRLEEVETPEMAEVFLINSMAPMVLNGRLKPLMMKGRPIPDPLPTRPHRPGAANKLRSLAEQLLEEQEGAEEAAREAAAEAAQKASGAGRKRPAAGATAGGAAKRERRMRNSGNLLGELAPPVPVELCRWIVNVSAMEGKFHRHKTANHPHTNAAKAALNMMTRTSGQDYARDFIYMTSVDTG